VPSNLGATAVSLQLQTRPPDVSTKETLLFHPVCQLLPERGEEEISLLAEDITRHGPRCPVVLLDGKVLDGRARLAACELAGVKPAFTAWCGEGSPVEWSITTNVMLHRLTYSQRVVLAYDALPFLDGNAQDGTEANSVRTIGELIRNGCAGDAARLTRTSIHHIRMMEKIESARPDLLDAVRRGERTLGEAKKRTGTSWHDTLPPRRRGDRFRKDLLGGHDVPKSH